MDSFDDSYLTGGTRHRGNPSSAVTPISHGLGGGIGVDRSRHGSNVTMVGGVTPQSHKRSLHGGDMDGKKAVSSTTTIVDDDVNRQVIMILLVSFGSAQLL